MKVPALLALTAIAAPAAADFTSFESAREGFQGDTFTDNGITFQNLNQFGGLNPDGSTYEPGEYGTQFIVENATLAANDYPDVLSGTNALSFSPAFIAGDNLSVNVVSSFDFTTGRVDDFASLTLLMFENGPWGGLTLSLEALRDGSVVNTDSFVISDLGGRDNLVGKHLEVSGVEFDTLRVSSRHSDGTYAAFAGLVDDVTVTPTPSGASVLIFAGLTAARRKRRG